MKKLYRKGTVHPSPPSPSDHLSFLPAAILALAIALSAEEKEVLAYLISGTGNHHHHRKNNIGGGGADHHPVSFTCYCFGCYMSYWVKWDSSPNRQLIHEIIDAFEEDAPPSAAASGGKKEKSKKARRKNNKNSKKNPSESSTSSPVKTEAAATTSSPEVVEAPADGGEGEVSGGEMEEEEMGKGSSSSVRRFVGYVGEKIWGIWS